MVTGDGAVCGHERRIQRRLHYGDGSGLTIVWHHDPGRTGRPVPRSILSLVDQTIHSPWALVRPLRAHQAPVSAVPSTKPCRSSTVSPAPRPASGSLLVALVRVKLVGPESTSVMVTVASTGTSWWFGGHSLAGLMLQVSVGGVRSMRSVSCWAGSTLPA